MARARRPARIAFFDAYALPGGASIALRDLIARIDRDRFEPLALLPRRGALAEMLEAVDCPVEVLEPPPPLGAFGRRLVEAGASAKLRAAAALARYTWTVAHRLRVSEVDLLHCNQTRAALEAGPGGQLAGARVVWNVRIRERLPRLVVRFVDECSDLIIPLTEHDFAGLPDEAHLRGRSMVIRNAVDTERFSAGRDRTAVRARLGLTDGERVLLSAGALVRRKGHDVAIRATARVIERVPGAKLLIAGGEPEGVEGSRAELEALIARRGVGESVTLLGPRSDMPDLLAACDALVLASRCEGDPAVVLEAMATARPVVVTEPAAAAVEDGVAGFVVPGGSAEALADAICTLLGDPARMRAMGEAGRRVVETGHDIRAMVRQYEHAWASLLR